MDDDHDRRSETDHAKEHFKQGMGLLFRAAREAATGFKKELDRAGIAKSLDDAGRELARAATNVVGRIEKEIKKVQPGEPSYMKREDPQDPQPWTQGGEHGAHQGEKPKGPTPDDPGFWATPHQGGGDDKKPQ
ncbi:MAG: hypothetical protein HUU21_23715 [Polyangiaceae bacterium]|nr:hypothetical protein [Polyangiaceae bacterium]NUQ76559.1 hypothetical protein [Polyangiaceae bacterium]